MTILDELLVRIGMDSSAVDEGTEQVNSKLDAMAGPAALAGAAAGGALQRELGVALFGDMAGEGADALWAMDPATAAAASGMDKAAGASKKLTDGMEDDPAQQMDAAMRTLTQGLGEALLPALLKVSEFISENKELMGFLVPVVGGLAIALVFAAAVWIANMAMLASPVTWIVLGIIALIAVIALIIIKWDAVAAADRRSVGLDRRQALRGVGVDHVRDRRGVGLDRQEGHRRVGLDRAEDDRGVGLGRRQDGRRLGLDRRRRKGRGR
ncbi:hypothetical protein SMICM304S_06785 [Streptomyces microflavus]